ncbi:MAG: ABC transporter permease [Microvirgula sp.]
MNRQRIVAVAYKEWREIVRDRLFFALAFVVPALLMVLFGYGLSFDVEHVPTKVIDYDRSAASRDYIARYTATPYFDLIGGTLDERAVGEQIARGEVRAALVIPPGFGQDMAAGRAVSVQTWVDGTFPSRALTIKGYLTAINANATSDRLVELLGASRGIGEADARALLQPIRLETRYLYNERVVSIWSLGPKLIMLILMLSPPFLTALGVVREKENGSIFNIYASNVSRGEFLIGKLAPYVGISSLNIVILWLMAVLLYQVPFKGSFAFFLFSTLIYVICTTGIGLVVSVLVRTQMAAMIVTMIVTMIPAVLYSGLIIPVASLGSAARVAADLLPAQYYTNIVVGCFLKGVGFAALWPDLLILTVYALLLFGAGYALFSKRPST